MKPFQITALAFVFAVLALGGSPARADLQSEIDQAVAILERLPDGALPESVMEKAYGLGIVDVFTLGAGVSLAGGQGVVVARTPTGWSPPSGIGFGSLGFGLQLGVKVTELVFVLNTPAAVEAFSKGNFELGVNLSVAFLPWGRTATGGITPDAAVFAYGRSQGLFAGVSLDGTFIGVREKDNASAYGKPVPAMSILRGEVAAPPEAAKLQEALAPY
jgi:lipid-binding SYLF domain-containing protein